MKTPNITTERLLLRGIQETDVQDIYDCWMQDERVSRYMCWKASSDIEAVKEFVRFELDQMESNSWYRFIITLKETEKIIGTCLIFWNEEENAWDISYNLGYEYWGNGYITEAMQAVMDYATEELNVKECVAAHAIENPASGRVIQKLGFEFEKEIVYECNGGDIVTTGNIYRKRLQ